MRLVLITGMHRAGTSLAARILNLAGVEFGPASAMMPPTPDNPRGYWEIAALTELNEKLLEHHGGRWHRLPALPDQWERAADLAGHRERAGGLLRELFGTAEVAGFKDPRTSVTLPWWQAVVDDLAGVTIAGTVLVLRSPAEVCRSVERRDGFALSHAAALYVDYVTAAWRNGPTPHVVTYESLLADPIRVARNLVDALALPPLTDDAAAAVAAFADASLRRSRRPILDPGTELRAADSLYRLLTSDAPHAVDGLVDHLGELVGQLRQLQGEEARQQEALRVAERDLRQVRSERDDARREREHVARERDQVTQLLQARQQHLDRAQSTAWRWEEEYRRLADRRVVRAGLRAVQPLRPVVRKVRELRGADPAGPVRPCRDTGGGAASSRQRPHRPAPEEQERALQKRLRQTVPGSERARGPLVSICVLNRNGADHLARLLPGLAGTTYRDFELVVVDNGSEDDSIATIERHPADYPVRVERNLDNRSFSAGNNQAAAVAAGEYLLLLNNDITPATPGWLASMVDALEQDEGVVAVGARLIYPRRPTLQDNQGDTIHPDLTLQHRGVHFDTGSDGIPRPRNLGAGEDPLSPLAAATQEMPAVTAACLLVRRDAYEAVGGLTEGYEYGTEDVDLCLKLRARGGKVVYCGDAVLWHHEYGTQNAEGRERKRVNRRHNRRLFTDLWGPKIFREVLRDRLLGSRQWSHEPLQVAITVTRDDPAAAWGDYYTAHEFGDALAELGYRVSYVERYGDRWYDLDPSVDVLVVLIDAFELPRLPSPVVTVAWVRNWTDRWVDRPWFNDYDLVLASSQTSQQLIEQRSSKTAHLFPLATNPRRFFPRPPDPDLAADALFVGNYWDEPRAITTALEQLPARVDVRVYGKHWERVPGVRRFHAGPLPYERLPDAYASAGVVIDDTAGHAKPYGAVNARVFDALAAGATVVSDNPVGVRELFGDRFPVWQDGRDLADHLQLGREAPQAATQRAAELRRVVLDDHTYERRAEQLRDALVAWLDADRCAIAIGVPRREDLAEWGDYHFARDTQRQLERSGLPTRLHILPEWEQAHVSRSDMVVHLFGLSEYRPRASQLTVLWNISHPELVTPEFVDRYDLACIASETFAAELAPQVQRPVRVLHQATDPQRFRPDATGPHHELLFVGNSRKVRRRIIDDLTKGPDVGYRLAIYGTNWTEDLVDSRFVAGDHVSNRDLPGYYGNADLVLNDHWDGMRDHGFLSNRLYDALACGAAVVSDDIDGIVEQFEGTVVTYRNPEELRARIRELMDDPALRRQLGEHGHEVVTARHTFADRVAALLGFVEPLLADRPRQVVGVGRSRGGSP